MFAFLRTFPAALALALALATLPWRAGAEPSPFDPGSAVAVVVKVPKPWYAPTSLVASRMRDTIPQYEAVPGLTFKAFSLAQSDARYGGIYLWKDQASARRFFSPAWFERVQKERGVAGEVRFYEVPVAIDNTPGGTPRDTDSRGVATLVTVAAPAGTVPLVMEYETVLLAWCR